MFFVRFKLTEPIRVTTRFNPLRTNPKNGHTQTILWQQPTNGLSVFDHFVGLALKVLRRICLFCLRFWGVTTLRGVFRPQSII